MTRVLSPFLVGALLLSAALLFAADQKARVTVLVRDVKLLSENAQPRAASLNETVTDDTAVRTGDESRSELTFVDLTITRLGSNTVFSFNKAGRSVRLNSGAMLLRVPKDSGGAEMQTNACSVAITGTTVVLEATRAGRNKLYVLEGNARMALLKRPNEWRDVAPGQMLDVPAGTDQLPEAKNFDVDRFMNTNPLITDFPPLPSRGLIATKNRNEHVYTSQPIDAATGPTRPAPPFVRRPVVPPSGTSGGTGNAKAPRPNRPRPVGIKNPTATPTPVIGRKLPPRTGSTVKRKPSPTPTPRQGNP